MIVQWLLRWIAIRGIGAIGVGLAFAVPGIGHATNWLMMEATEPVGAPALSSYASISLEYQATRDTLLLAGAWRGQPDQFNRFSPRYADGEVLQIPAATLGAHGRAVDGNLTYRLSAVAGENAIVKNQDGYFRGPFWPLDASATLHLIPYARLRMGLFRQPLGDEATAPVPRYINFSHVTQQMVQERYFASDGSVNGNANLDEGPVSVFRDFGVEAFDAFIAGQWEHTYAVMLGRGTGVDPALNRTGIERYLYWSSEYILGGKGTEREGLKIYAWGQFGERTLKAGPTQDEQIFDRRRAGIGATLFTGRWSVSSEWINAQGMIYNGPDGGTIPGNISNNGALVAGYNVLPKSKAHGWYVDVGYRILDPLLLRLRYDLLHRGTDSPSTDIQFQGVSVGGSYAITTRSQIIIDYQFRRYNAPQLEGSNPTNVLLSGVDNRIGIRFTQQFSF